MSRPLKRSFTLDGHRTSVSLEAPFWEALQDVARAEGLALAALVQRIDRERGGGPDEAASDISSGSDIGLSGGLSGAIRIYILRYYQRRATQLSRDA